MAARSFSVFVATVLVASLEPGLAQPPMGQYMQFSPLLDDIMVGGISTMDSMNLRGGPAAPGGAAAPGAAGPLRPSMHLKEDQMDRDMEAMFGALLGSIGKPAPQELLAGQAPLGAKTGRPETVGNIDMPLEAFQGLFPGPLVLDNGPISIEISGSGGPDPIIMEMLGETHSGFQETMLPMVHAAAKQDSMSSPILCQADFLKHCGTSRSQLHCLGTHQEDISKECRDSVGKSVPFVCSANIDRYCDTLHGGILPCLELHMDALESDCKDAVETTRNVITTANTHKVKLASPQTGATASVTPSPQVLAEARKAVLDRKAAELASSASMWGAVKYVLFFLSFSALVYFLYTAPTVFRGWGGRSREGQRLLASTEMPKPVDGFKL